MEVTSLISALGIPSTLANRVLFGIVQGLLLFVAIWLFVRAGRKYREIRDPVDNCPWLQTYSYLSIQMVKCVRIILLMQIGLQMGQLAINFIPDAWFTHMFADPGQTPLTMCITQFTQLSGDLAEGNVSQFFVDFFRMGFYLDPVWLVTLSEMIVYLQAYEWAAMKRLIDYQMDKSVEQIVYEYEAENIHEKLRSSSQVRSEKQLDFRRKELCFKRRMNLISVASLILYILSNVLLFLFIQGVYTEMMVLYLVGNLSITIWQNYIFFPLYFTMKKHHRYEFERTKKTMKMQILGANFASFCFFLYLISSFILRDSIDEKGCIRAVDGGDAIYHTVQFVVIAVFYFQIPTLVTAFTIVVLKSPQDILQGISKLDYLMKVSVFQIEKGKPVDTNQTLGHVTTFKRDSSVNSEGYLSSCGD